MVTRSDGSGKGDRHIGSHIKNHYTLSSGHLMMTNVSVPVALLTEKHPTQTTTPLPTRSALSIPRFVTWLWTLTQTTDHCGRDPRLTLNQAPPDKELPPPLCTWAQPLHHAPSLGLTGPVGGGGAGASPPVLLIDPLSPSFIPVVCLWHACQRQHASLMDRPVYGCQSAWWATDITIGTCVPAVHTGLGYSAEVKERHPAPIEKKKKSMPSPASLKLEL